jgi:hypothetical protein
MASQIEDAGRIEAAELMQEILAAGIRALDGEGQARRSAEAWTRADDPSWPLSFRNVCEALGLEPEVVRTELLASDAG